ncbi:unnamed protein product [Ranitomeya imitator]|uniref:RNase H type-1 domain-containing protein n=1 Tax=Ranitomeya imitator TaxID=111125 RepID=A0ABN9KYD5_9NEOB|nr:unnamed protein product [Ranitomeya imitator]
MDGSRYADDEGRFHTGCAVISNQEILWSRSLPPSLSAQYLHGIGHDFGPIWAARDFITASGTAVKHHGAIKDLLDALQLPKMVALLKIKAHGKLNTVEAWGNNMMDMAAKGAAKGRQYGEVGEVVEPDGYYMMTEDKKPDQMTSWDLLTKLQEQAPKDKKECWMRKGATHEEGRVYAMDYKPCLP